MQHLPPDYLYNGARSLVILHEQHLTRFVATWETAYDMGLILPDSDDPDYQSMEHLLVHVLRSARGYLTWICENLALPDPGIEPVPDVHSIVAEADLYRQHVSEKWRAPLAGIPEQSFHSPTYESRWGVHYCIDAMLEHAVMHPIRHEFQLSNLMKKQLGEVRQNIND
jgi:uncharacterized damage-inducible protein DinB